MEDTTRRPVLVLNSCYEPLSICSGRRALKMMFKGVAKAEEHYPTKVGTHTMWDENTGDFITVDMMLPAVIRLLTFRYIPVRTPLVTRNNIFNRHKNRCAYCNKHITSKTGTLDHVIPRAKGGKSTWENLVACCLPCNRKKGDTLLEDLTDMRLLTPARPLHAHTSRHILRNLGAEDPKWRKYLYFENPETQSMENFEKYQ